MKADTVSDTELLDWLSRQRVGFQYPIGGGWETYAERGFSYATREWSLREMLIRARAEAKCPA